MFDFLDDVADFFTPRRPVKLEPAFSGFADPEPATESFAIPDAAPDYSGLSSYVEDEPLESVDVTAYESDGRIGEDLDELFAGTSVTGFNDIDGFVDSVIEAADGAPLGRVDLVDHAAPGIQEVGDEDLTLASLEDPETVEDLQRLGAKMGPDGHLYLKGCRVGGDEAGDAFLRGLARTLDHPVTGSSEYQTPLIPGMDGPIKTCYPPEFDEETQKTWQTCTTTTNPVANAYDKVQDWIGGGIFDMDQSDME